MPKKATEQRASERTTLNSPPDARLLQVVVRSAPDAIVTMDSASIIRSFNPAAEKLFGYASEEAVGQSVKILMPPHFRERHDAYVADYLATGKRRIVGIGRVVVGQHKDGSTFPIELFVSETTVDSSQIFIGFIRDLSDLDHEHRRVQELQAKLFHVSRLSEMGQLAAGLAHEINQPLAAITNYALVGRNAARQHHSEKDLSSASCFEKIEQQARRAADIIRRLRSFVERREIEFEDADLYVLIEEALALAMAGPAGRGVRVHLKLPDDALRIHVDRIQIQQVLVNLVRNAIDAMEGLSRREVTIGAALDEAAFVRVVVSDVGRGLSDHVASRLFESFVTTKAQGLGVGLSISQAIIEAHGGRIWFTRNASAGVTFHFTVPLVRETGVGPNSDHNVPRSRQGTDRLANRHS
ncbi:PAS domain-containing sensor histidine kinase [Chelativorans xinjiangense]|uniref:PAS domain-containing sensor histidine kinase n=1 Tax=Chelativorans xinjiangense TaxID=2681485 RepID=UPI0013591F88|nr:PAS domain S-box protein [Chelativorans xinjiangense]